MNMMYAVIVGAFTVGCLTDISFFRDHHWSDSPQKPPHSAPAQPVVSPFVQKATWQQVYSLQPDGAIDTGVWNALEGNNNGWGNNELQVYTGNKENARVEDGTLTIEAKKTGAGYTSARLTTEGNFDFKYGKLDVVAKLPTGKGVWPAMWFLPSDYKYSTDATSVDGEDISWLSNGEMDMIEGSAQGDNGFSASAHSLGHYPGHAMRTGEVTVDSPTNKFHTYSLQWTPKAVEFLVDGVAFHRVENSGEGFKDWPYDQRFHLIMNVAMGGTMSEDLKSEEFPNGVDDSGSPWLLKVQSISYYPLTAAAQEES